MKLKVVVVWVADMVHGPCVHWFFAVYRTPSSGTLRLSSGTLKVWATPHVVSELTTEIPLPLTPAASPLTVMTPPTVPLTSPLNWLRSGSQVSNSYAVTLIRVCAGSCQIVEWTQLPVCGLRTK